MKFSLRTLIVVMLLGGPAIGAVWWLAGYAQTLTWLMRAGMAVVVAHGIYAIAAPLPDQNEPAKLSAVGQVGLWFLQAVSLFIPMWGLCLSIGFILFRNKEGFDDIIFGAVISPVFTLCLASLVSARIALGLARKAYPQILACSAAFLLALSLLACLCYMKGQLSPSTSP